jgi:sugar phosphate isomerase/epimerase
LTLELPKAHPDKINIRAVKELIENKNLPVVGHTAWYLPIGSPFKELRLYSLSELEKCALAFQKLGVEKMNVHFDKSISLLKEKHVIDLNIWTLRKLVSTARKYNLRIMAENTPGLFSNPVVLQHVFRKVPRLLLHLDIAHANSAPKNQTPAILKSSQRS